MQRDRKINKADLQKWTEKRDEENFNIFGNFKILTILS